MSRLRVIGILAAVLAIGCGNGDSGGTGGSGAGGTGQGGTTSTGGTTTDADVSTSTGAGTGGSDTESLGGDAAATAGETRFEVCGSNEDCDNGQICDCLGACVAPGIPEIPFCEKDINCGSDNWCDKCASVCRPRKGLCEPCTQEGECLDGGACIDFASGGRFCLRACVSDVGCPAAAFRCEAIAGQSTHQCTPLSGGCAKPALCTDDTECEFGAICDKGKCKPGCPSDDVCPKDHVCTGFKCVPGCSAQNPCPTGQDCDAAGHCKVPGGCVEPKDCPEPETYCDLAELMCKPGCQADFDCKASAKECVGGSCVDKGCTGNFLCAFEQVCNFANAKCEDAVGPYCEKGCDPQSDASCGGKPNVCLSLQDQDGNALGDFCFVACGPDPKNPCPQGYSCEEVEMPDSTSQLCFRDCTFEPYTGEKIE